MATELEPSLSNKRDSTPRSSRTKQNALGWLFCGTALVPLACLTFLRIKLDFLYPALLIVAMGGYGTRLLGLTKGVGYYWCVCGIIWLASSLLGSGPLPGGPPFSVRSFWYPAAVSTAPFAVFSAVGVIILYLNREKEWWGWILCIIPCGIVTLFSDLMAHHVSGLSLEYTAIGVWGPLLLLWYVALRLAPVSDCYAKIKPLLFVATDCLFGTVLIGWCVFSVWNYATLIVPQYEWISSANASKMDPSSVAVFKEVRRSADTLLMLCLYNSISLVMFIYLVVLLRLRTNSGKKRVVSDQIADHGTPGGSSES